MNRSSLKTWVLASLPAGVLVAVSVWALLAQRCEMDNAPTHAQWEEVRSILRQHYRPNDVVRTAPYWADQARVGLFDMTHDLTRFAEDEQLYRFDRLWIVADREHGGDALASLPETYRLEQEWHPNDLTALYLVEIPEPTHVLYDIVSHIEEADVVRRYGDRIASCELFANGGWHCDQVNPWLHVTPMEQEVGGTLRRCLYAGMHPDCELVVSWYGIEFGTSVAGNVGNTMPAVRADRGSDINFRIEIDGEVEYQLRFHKWDPTFFEFDLDTQELAGGLHDLSFAFHADDFFDRWVCFRARVLR